MTKIVIHNKSKLNFETPEGIIAGNGFLEVSKNLAEKLLKYPQLSKTAITNNQAAKDNKKLKAENEKLKAELEALKSLSGQAKEEPKAKKEEAQKADK